MQRFALPAAVFLVLIQDGRVLLLRRGPQSWCAGCYDLPAGHLDGGEYATAALAREANEEIGVTFKPQDARFVHAAHFIDAKAKTEYLNLAFQVDTWQGEPHLREPHKHDDLQWFPLDHLPDNMTPGTRAILDSLHSGGQYAEITM